MDKDDGRTSSPNQPLEHAWQHIGAQRTVKTSNDNLLDRAEQSLQKLKADCPKADILSVHRLRENLKKYPGTPSEAIRDNIRRCDEILQKAVELGVI